MHLVDWAESIFNVVEQDGATTARVKLITPMNGDVWHTWFAPFPSPQDWAPLAESVLRGLENQCAGRQQVSFVAEARSGETLSQLPWKVIGKLQSGNLESAQQAAAATFASLAQTVERITELSNRSLDGARQQLELSLSAQVQQMELLRAYREREFEAHAEHAPGPLSLVLESYGPQLAAAMELGMAFLVERAQRQRNGAAVVREEQAPPPPSTPPPPPPKAKGGPRKAPPTDTVVKRKR